MQRLAADEIRDESQQVHRPQLQLSCILVPKDIFLIEINCYKME